MRHILSGISGLGALFVAVVASWPSAFHVERAITIAAPPRVTFEQVDDRDAWNAWSPWTGRAHARVEEAEAPSRIAAHVEFVDPWPGSAMATFMIRPHGKGTRVVWSLDTDNSFLEKAAYLFLDLGTRESVQADMEAGLVALKTASERASAVHAALTSR